MVRDDRGWDKGKRWANDTSVDTDNFDGILSSTDDNVQDALESLDNLEVQVPVCISMYSALPTRNSEGNWNGGILKIADAKQLGPATPANNVSFTKGIGKMVFMVLAGSDVSGTITITGNSVNRNTGAVTIGDTDVITINGLSTDGSTTDTNGHIKHTFTDGYISSKWFTGTIVLSTSTLNISDLDVYHCSFEQWNDSPSIVLNTFDVNLFTTNALAKFDGYLYTIHVTNGRCRIDLEAELHIGAGTHTAIADKYWRLRRGNIAEAINGTTDGFWCDLYYSNNPTYIEDVTAKVWATQTIAITKV